MITFPNCKINLGLSVTEKRNDGYHNIETCMVPVHGLCDALEIIKNENDTLSFSSSGLNIDGNEDTNLCVKAYRLTREKYPVGGVKMHLHKHIPFGAGLGGGSADAVFALKMLDQLFELHLTVEELEALAGELGSDTVFFARNNPMLATGRGEILTPAMVDLRGYYLMMVKPDVFVSTADAYRNVKPRVREVPLTEILNKDIRYWKESLVNDFESPVFDKYPELEEIKQSLYDQGALYAAMSGSGSTLFGIFDREPTPLPLQNNYFTHIEKVL